MTKSQLFINRAKRDIESAINNLQEAGRLFILKDDIQLEKRRATYHEISMMIENLRKYEEMSPLDHGED